MSNVANIADRASTMQDIFTEIDEIAHAHAYGETSLIRFGMMAVRRSMANPFLMDKDKDGKDAAHYMFQRYQNSYSETKLIKSLPQQVSKLRAFLRLGTHANVDGETLMNKTLETYERLKEAGHKVKTPYQSMVDVAVLQNNTQQPISDAEVEDKILKTEKDKTELDFIKAAITALDKAQEMKPRDNTYAARQMLKEVMLKIEAEGKQAKRLEEYRLLRDEFGDAA
jgi:hypothetical protein